MPTLVVGGTPHVLQHPSEAGVLLGLGATAPLGDARQVAWDIDEIVGAWLELLEITPWEALQEPLPRLARTPLDLGVDSLVGIAALTRAFSTGWFHWPGNPETGVTGDAAVVGYQDAIVETIGSRDGLLGFARPVAQAWRDALLDYDEALRSDSLPRFARREATCRGSACSRRSGSTRRSTIGRRRGFYRSVAGRCRRSTSRACRASSCPNSSTSRAA